MTSPRSILLLFGILLVVLAGPVLAIPQEYTIEPGFGVTGIAAPDIVSVSFGDLTVREMVLVMALAISPILLIPAEILFALKLLSFLGFRRILRSNVLTNTVRKEIYSCICERPGISPGELAGATGISRGALAYHIALLRGTGKIVPVKTHGAVGWFENSEVFSQSEQAMLTCLRSETDRKILGILSATPALSRAELGQRLGVSGPTVTWHMKRLASDGAVRMHREGKFSRYVISDAMAAFLKRTGNDIRHCDTSPALSDHTLPASALVWPVES